MIKALLRNEALRSDIDAFSAESGFKVWWLGQSGFLLKYNGKIMLFDPYLSNSLSIKYANTDKPHVRISELVIEPSLLPKIAVITSSHNHTDHLDAETLKPILKANSEIKFIIPEANRAFVSERVGCNLEMPLGLNDGLKVNVGEFEITGIPAAHNKIERDKNGCLKCMGFIVKFGKYKVYHSGDTLWYQGLNELIADVDLAFLPINGNLPERKVSGNLNYEEAARLGKEAHIKCVIPHHYDLFEFNTEDVKLFEQKCAAYKTPFKTLRLGEGYFFN